MEMEITIHQLRIPILEITIKSGPVICLRLVFSPSGLSDVLNTVELA